MAVSRGIFGLSPSKGALFMVESFLKIEFGVFKVCFQIGEGACNLQVTLLQSAYMD